MKIVGATGFGGLWALEWAWHIRNKLALRTRLRNLNLRSHFSTFDSFRYIRVHIYVFLKFVGVANFFLGRSIGINENNTFQLKFLF